MDLNLRQCVLSYAVTDGVRLGGSRSQTYLKAVSGKSSLRHLEAKRCPILTGSCVNKSVFRVLNHCSGTDVFLKVKELESQCKHFTGAKGILL